MISKDKWVSVVVKMEKITIRYKHEIIFQRFCSCEHTVFEFLDKNYPSE